MLTSASDHRQGYIGAGPVDRVEEPITRRAILSSRRDAASHHPRSSSASSIFASISSRPWSTSRSASSPSSSAERPASSSLASACCRSWSISCWSWRKSSLSSTFSALARSSVHSPFRSSSLASRVRPASSTYRSSRCVRPPPRCWSGGKRRAGNVAFGSLFLFVGEHHRIGDLHRFLRCLEAQPGEDREDAALHQHVPHVGLLEPHLDDLA